jgi:hypothetical protein
MPRSGKWRSRWRYLRNNATDAVFLVEFPENEEAVAQILLGCWMLDGDTTTLRDTAKSDAVAITLRDAVRLCLETAENAKVSSRATDLQPTDAKADAA